MLLTYCEFTALKERYIAKEKALLKQSNRIIRILESILTKSTNITNTKYGPLLVMI